MYYCSSFNIINIHECAKKQEERTTVMLSGTKNNKTKKEFKEERLSYVSVAEVHWIIQTLLCLFS